MSYLVMPDDRISPCADDPLVGRLAGILCRMVKAGKLKHLDSCRPKLSVQVCGVSRDTVHVNTRALDGRGRCLHRVQREMCVDPGPGRTRTSPTPRAGRQH